MRVPSSAALPAEWQLLAPHFTGRVRLTVEQSQALRCGQLTTVGFRSGEETIGRAPGKLSNNGFVTSVTARRRANPLR